MPRDKERDEAGRDPVDPEYGKPAPRTPVKDELAERVDSLEYPRHMHKPAGEFLVVNNAEEAKAAYAEGWKFEVPEPPKVDNELPEARERPPAASTLPVPETELPNEPGREPEPRKRDR